MMSGLLWAAGVCAAGAAAWGVHGAVRSRQALRAAQDALQRTHKLLEASQAVSRVGAWEETIGPVPRAAWTEQMFRLLELSPAEFTPTPGAMLGFMAPESVAPLREALAREEAAGGIGHDLELVMVTARGRRFWAHSRSALTLEGGQPVWRTVVVRDITLHKTAQQAQRQAWALHKRTSERLELALQGAQLALWVFDVPTGRVTHAQRWEQFGHARVPAHQDEWGTLIHPEDLDRRQAALSACIGGASEVDDAEYRLRTGQGAWVWVRARGRIVSRDAHGRPQQYAGVVMDISAQVAARQVVHDQRQFLQAMMEGIDIGVAVSGQGGVVYANASLRRMLGYAPDEPLAGSDTARLLAPEEHAAEAERQQSLARGIEVPVAICNLLRKDGSHLRAALNLSLVEWNGEPHYITTVAPLSEHDLLETQVRATQVRFERVLISELEAQQAHIARELHDSLGSELAGLALVLGGARHAVAIAPGGADPQVTEQLDSAATQVKAAVEVTRALARGLTPVGDSPGALWRALERLAHDWRTVRGVACELHVEGDLDAVPADLGNHLYRIAQEALTNAVRHGGATRLDIHLARKHALVRLSVCDNGCGFDVQRLHKGHVGLGVRSMMARARVIGGKLRFSQPAGGGTEVRVALRTGT